MKPRYYLVVLLALLAAALACNLPWGQAEGEEITLPGELEVVTEQVPTPVTATEVILPDPTLEEPDEAPFACGPDMVPTTAFNVEFCYPGQYSNGYTQSMVAENPPDGDMPIWGINPDTIEITLTGYPVINQYHDPIIRIYPVDDFIALEPYIQTLVDELGALLASGATNPANIPFVPIFNAAQMIQAQVTHLRFQNGRGVRFITYYGQAAAPISNDSAFYAFMGLTDDGAYLISATLPVTHPLFYPDVFTEPAEGWETFSNNFEVYLNTIEADLEVQPQDAFFPDLAPLDEMMSSFLIPADAIP